MIISPSGVIFNPRDYFTCQRPIVARRYCCLLDEVTPSRHMDEQEKNRLGCPISKKLGLGFHHWYKHLENLWLLTVQRCFRFHRRRWTQQHLRVFTHASTKWFGAVEYFRSVFEDQLIKKFFVLAKTHVTPVTGLTIPSMELQAAGAIGIVP